MKLAAVDIGSNSCRLLIAEVCGDKLEPLCRDMDTTRIGQGVNATQRLSLVAIKRTISCLKHFRELIQRYETGAQRVVATSAVREAANSLEFIRQVEQECGLQVEVIQGEEEACLSYEGARRGLGLKDPPLVVDLGGGSTEFVWLGKKRLLTSLPIGAVRASEAAMTPEMIASILAPLGSWKAEMQMVPLVFVGGTATSMIAIKLALKEYNSQLVHGQTLKFSEVEALYRRLSSLSRAELRSLPGLQTKRADIIVQGVLITLLIMEKLGREELVVSESDLLDAVIWQLYAKI